MAEEQGSPHPQGDGSKAAAVVIGALLVLVGIGLIGGRIWEWLIPGFAPWRFYFGEWRRWTFALGLVVAGILLVGYSSRVSVRLPTKDSRLYRSRSERMVSGVLGGLADYFGMDATIVRLVFVAFALIIDGGAALLAYIAAAIIMPEEPVSSGEAAAPPPPGGGSSS